MHHQFRNDYSVLAHPRIMKALARFADEENVAYGLDEHSEIAAKYIRNIFVCPNAKVFFLAGGTQTNMVFLSSTLKQHEAVVSLETGHIYVHETGAVEGSGHKIITVKGQDGKIFPEDIEMVMSHYIDEHMVKPRVVYISNSTEIGTIYSRGELESLRKVCDKYNLYLFMDGARLGSALTCSICNTQPNIIAKTCDAFYIGGTKNGLMLGEALVIVNEKLGEDFRYVIKNKGAMLSKGYGVGIQFEEAFKDGLYFEIARKTNVIADYLKLSLEKCGFCIVNQPTNQVFIEVDEKLGSEIMKEFGAELWDKENDKMTIRLVVSFVTTKEDVDELIQFIKNHL